jgi:hypothetical protein
LLEGRIEHGRIGMRPAAVRVNEATDLVAKHTHVISPAWASVASPEPRTQVAQRDIAPLPPRFFNRLGGPPRLLCRTVVEIPRHAPHRASIKPGRAEVRWTLAGARKRVPAEARSCGSTSERQSVPLHRLVAGYRGRPS